MSTRNVIDKGMVQRLKDNLAVNKHRQEIQENRRKLDEIAFYPKHDKRRETKEYKEVHKRLVVDEDSPCLVCGVRNSTLKDRSKNLYGARAMETHHHIIEWALANAVSLDKFNHELRPSLARRHADKEEYKKDFTEEQIRNWVDNSEDNLWVLCDVHHRAKFFGIHEISYPIWVPMDLLRDDFEQYAKAEIAKASLPKKVTSRKKVNKKSNANKK